MIKTSRRDWIAGAMAGTALLRARSAAAQAYPQRAGEDHRALCAGRRHRRVLAPARGANGA